MPPPASLPSLRELHIDAIGTFAQTVRVLSLAVLSSLEILGLYGSAILSPDKSTSVWAEAPSGGCFPHVHTLNIGHWYDEALPAEVLVELPRYFPSLSSFNLKCGASGTDYVCLLSTDIETSLSVFPRELVELKALLLSIPTICSPNRRLHTIRIDLDYMHDRWEASSEWEIILLSKDACSAAQQNGISLRPTDLPDQLAKLAVLERERQSSFTSGWG
jgi:hypothetical protein